MLGSSVVSKSALQLLHCTRLTLEPIFNGYFALAVRSLSLTSAVLVLGNTHTRAQGLWPLGYRVYSTGYEPKAHSDDVTSHRPNRR